MTLLILPLLTTVLIFMKKMAGNYELWRPLLCAALPSLSQ
jgi:hypothetical protein